MLHTRCVRYWSSIHFCVVMDQRSTKVSEWEQWLAWNQHTEVAGSFRIVSLIYWAKRVHSHERLTEQKYYINLGSIEAPKLIYIICRCFILRKTAQMRQGKNRDIQTLKEPMKAHLPIQKRSMQIYFNTNGLTEPGLTSCHQRLKSHCFGKILLTVSRSPSFNTASALTERVRCTRPDQYCLSNKSLTSCMNRTKTRQAFAKMWAALVA